MQGKMTIRICSTCNKPLTFKPDGTQEGIYCCDEYFHEGECIEASFKHEPKPTTWLQHYEEVGGNDGECYYTEWEPEYITDKEADNA